MWQLSPICTRHSRQGKPAPAIRMHEKYVWIALDNFCDIWNIAWFCSSIFKIFAKEGKNRSSNKQTTEQTLPEAKASQFSPKQQIIVVHPIFHGTEAHAHMRFNLFSNQWQTKMLFEKKKGTLLGAAIATKVYSQLLQPVSVEMESDSYYAAQREHTFDFHRSVLY